MNLEHLRTLLEKAGIPVYLDETDPRPGWKILTAWMGEERCTCLIGIEGDVDNCSFCMAIARAVWGEWVYFRPELNRFDLQWRLGDHATAFGFGPTWEAALVSALERKVEPSPPMEDGK